MRIRVICKGTDGRGEQFIKDMFELPVVYTKANKFDELTQWVFASALSYLEKEETDVIVVEKIRPEAVDNGDGTGSLKGALVGMGF